MPCIRTSVSFAAVACIYAATSFPSPSIADSTTADGRALSPRSNQTSCHLGAGEESHQVGHGPAPLWPWQIYRSSPFNPPELEINQTGQSLAAGLIFITPSEGSNATATKEVAPLILTDAGQLVWNGPSVNATNLRVATYEGQSILTYWSGFSTAGANIGHGYGSVTFLDESYSEILTLCPDLGLSIPGDQQFSCQADLHESFVTDRNTILISAYNATPADLSSVGGPVDGWVYDSLFFEIDPKNGSILFRWSSLEHVPVAQTKLPLQSSGESIDIAFDYFHINSIVNIGDDYFLVNARHTWATYLVNAAGEILWTLQGETGGDFGTLPPNGQFAWQHYARPHKVTNSSMSVSYFNNFNTAMDNGTRPSNGLELQLPLPPNKSNPPVVLQALAVANEPIYADSQGSHSILENGNNFLDYGMIAVVREFGPANQRNLSGDLRWSARFGADNEVQSYRGFRHEWHATPSSSPSLFVEGSASGCGTGYVSWNGATDVESWVLSEGETQDMLEVVGEVGYKGFETSFGVANQCVQVGALIGGKVVRSSNVVCTGS